MDILNVRAITEFIAKHADSKAPLNDWVVKTRAATWKNNSDVQQTFSKADHPGGQKFIFNIGGNNYRTAAMVWIHSERVYVLKVMTHDEYSKEKFWW